MKKNYLTLYLLMTMSFAHAEYRVYQYSLNNNSQLNANSLIVSTLDPVTFRAYRTAHSNNQFELLRTWMCPGYTGGRKDYCPSPYEKLQQELVQ